MDVESYPVRFVKILHFKGQDYIFIGCGGKVHVYEIRPNLRHLFCYEVFTSTYVHGIEENASTNTLCIYGRRFFRIANFCTTEDDEEAGFQLNGWSAVVDAGDWIWAVKWLTESQLVFLLGHNQIRIFSLGQQITVDFCVQCDECCLLYSGIFVQCGGRSEDRNGLRVISGTIFNEVLVWSPFDSTKVVHRLRGHKGVIFNVNFDCQRGLLCSVSDDRSCRLWRFISLDGSTVFGDCGPSADQWRNGRFEALHVLYGHEARVWRAIPIRNGLVSVGEDGVICLWEIERGRLIKKWKAQRGGIRALAFHSPSGSLICGTDSGCIFSVSMDGRDVVPSGAIFDEFMFNSEEDVTAVYYTGDDANVRWVPYVTVSSHGNVLYWASVKESKLLIADPTLRYSTGHHIGNRLILGGLEGRVYLFDFANGPKQENFQLVDGKIFSVHFVGMDGEKLLICLKDGIMGMWDVRNLTNGAPPSNSFQLPLGKQPWLQCCMWVSVQNGTMESVYLVAGDRNGGIYFYSISTEQQDTVRKPIQSFPKIHGKKEVTDFTQDWNQENAFQSIGRDGCWRKWRFQGSPKNEWMVTDCEKLSSHFEWLSKFIWRGQDLMIAGFRSNKLVLYDVTSGHYLCQIECGGGHRSYDLRILDDSNHRIYVKALFTKQGRVCQAMQQLDTICDIQPSIHVRRITDVVPIASENEKTDQTMLATCSEDTTIAVWKVEKGDLKLHHRLKGHISSVHCLCYNGRWLISGGGRGEICWWNTACESGPYRLVYRQKNDKDDVRCLGLQTFNHGGIDYTLGIFSDGRLSLYAKSCSRFRPVEIAQFHSSCCLTRIRLHQRSSAHDLPFIFLIGTNGKLHIVSPNSILNIIHSNGAISSAKSMWKDTDDDDCAEEEMGNMNDADVSLYTTAMKNRTRRRKIVQAKEQEKRNGVVMEGELENIAASMLVENSGLTALDVKWRSDVSNVLVCMVGAESGTLHALTMRISKIHGDIELLSRTRFPDWHVSTVTGLSMIGDSYLASNSVDQRIGLWTYQVQSSCVEVQFYQDVFSHVADPANIRWIHTQDGRDYVIICGSGIQTVQLALPADGNER